MEDILSLLVTQCGESDHWSVWITLPDHDPIEDAFGFVVGTGATRQAALESAVERLQGPIGTVPERRVAV